MERIGASRRRISPPTDSTKDDRGPRAVKSSYSERELVAIHTILERALAGEGAPNWYALPGSPTATLASRSCA
jgi:hypothetical protein